MALPTDMEISGDRVTQIMDLNFTRYQAGKDAEDAGGEEESIDSSMYATTGGNFTRYEAL